MHLCFRSCIWYTHLWIPHPGAQQNERWLMWQLWWLSYRKRILKKAKCSNTALWRTVLFSLWTCVVPDGEWHLIQGCWLFLALKTKWFLWGILFSLEAEKKEVSPKAFPCSLPLQLICLRYRGTRRWEGIGLSHFPCGFLIRHIE